ncbi:hypothetical protein HCA39_09965, partial [Listeria seeligeri]|nr:hypothetical protein [Listeria seeligeri]MBC6132325.1 hypothetical protein [Listeria seeligeri]MBF2553408.1 hypothetical protein [Listeria seeligeri]MBF2643631.1 hypothetical protein [Listeria seeligeri]
MATAIRKEQSSVQKNVAFLTSRKEVDYLERESFFITVNDAKKRAWVVGECNYFLTQYKKSNSISHFFSIIYWR